jgi:hypothetical protein
MSKIIYIIIVETRQDSLYFNLILGYIPFYLVYYKDKEIIITLI